MLSLKQKALRAIVDITGAVGIVCIGVVLLLSYFDVLTK